MMITEPIAFRTAAFACTGSAASAALRVLALG
jgi:hypothetical protein